MKMWLVASLLMLISPSWAQADTKDRIVELQGGDRVVVRADGTMAHYDARGVLMPMPEGVMMTTVDGSRVIMKEQSLWHEILDIVGSTYGRATAQPYLPKAGPREIALQNGGRLVVDTDGRMAHYDRSGRAVTMKDGEIMTAADGSRIMMVNGAAWRETAKAGRSAPRP